MMPTKQYGQLPVIGVEIEVPAWDANVVRADVCKNLIANAFMPATAGYQDNFHNYHCDCNHCRRWVQRTGGGPTVPYPVQFSMTYDASLPQTGGEFISSPFVLNDVFMMNFREAYSIICGKAKWTNKLDNFRGDGKCSPSIHVHASAMNPYQEDADGISATFMRTIYGYVPELFALASACGIKRGLTYRLPYLRAPDWTNDRNAGHHLFVNNKSRREAGGRYNYLEWRLWEAAYDDMPYINGIIYLSGALTQIAVNPDLIDILSGYSNMVPWYKKNDPPRIKSEDELQRHFNTDRLEVLERALLQFTFLTIDPVGYGAVADLFRRVK